MKKIVKKYGDSLVISFSKEEIKIYDIHEGNIIDFVITKVKGGNVKNGMGKK
jgi:hypothetical protein